MASMPNHARLFVALGALAAAAAVAIGAISAHHPAAAGAAALPMFQTALQLHQFHALGLIAVGLAAARLPESAWVKASGLLMIAGLLLFSGNLYLRSFAGFDTLRTLTPWGGVSWLAGWIAFGVGVLRKRTDS
jgi:uncharacterized membrane protein YgdD (TMEM256/DUF423 family)